MIFEWPRPWYQFINSEFDIMTYALGQVSTFRRGARSARLIEQVWTAQYTAKPTRGPSKWQGQSAFFARLGGDVNFMRIGDPLRCAPLYNRIPANKPIPDPFSDNTYFSDTTGWVDGAVPPTATIDQSERRGSNNLILGNLPPSVERLLNAGDLFEIRPNGIVAEVSCLHMVVGAGHTDEDGRCGIEIRPSLRLNVAAGDQVVFAYPQALMKLMDGSQGRISRAGNVGSFGFSCMEWTG